MTLNFKVKVDTRWGETVFLTGNTTELGKWNITKAIKMTPDGIGNWFCNIDINSAKRGISYKYFVTKENDDEIFFESEQPREISFYAEQFENVEIADVWHDMHAYKSIFSSSALKKTYPVPKKKIKLPKAKNKVVIKGLYPVYNKQYKVAITGNAEILGNWVTPVDVECTNYPEFTLFFDTELLPEKVEYKFVIVDKESGEIIEWESGENRFFEKSQSDISYVDAGFLRLSGHKVKFAGLSIPVFSIRTRKSFGAGDFTDLKKIVDLAVKSDMKIIQLLPINDTISSKTYLDSYPYNGISVFALHPLYLNIFSLGKLQDTVLETKYKSYRAQLSLETAVDYQRVVDLKLEYAREIFKIKRVSFLKSKQFKEFFDKNKSWLPAYSAFCYLRDKYGTSNFSEWEEYADYKSEAVDKLFNSKSPAYYDITFWYFIQYNLDKQLKQAVKYSTDNGVIMKGDIPIGINKNSADAWSNPKLYNFDGQAGAPPDYFSADGQNWGFPTYNWEEMEKDNYKWWRERLTKMAEYFDAYRIDHIIGFFRIWEIPSHAQSGVFGHFRPALPFSIDELSQKGIGFDYNRMCKPYIRGHFLNEIFGEYTGEVIAEYLINITDNVFELKEEYSTQKKILSHFGNNDSINEKQNIIKRGLLQLTAEVLLLPANGDNSSFYPRISLQSTYSYRELDDYLKQRIDEIYVDYFYHRHEQYWRQQAMKKLPAIISATNMLVCGEDLGMVPDSVPGVMHRLGILSLDMERMAKQPNTEFDYPRAMPYMSVCTTSTHDMTPMRVWWEEEVDRAKSYFYNYLEKSGDFPKKLTAEIAYDIILRNMQASSMWAILPIQDIVAVEESLFSDDAKAERINDPANAHNYWNYRFHVEIEEVLKNKKFLHKITDILKVSGRLHK